MSVSPQELLEFVVEQAPCCVVLRDDMALTVMRDEHEVHFFCEAANREQRRSAKKKSERPSWDEFAAYLRSTDGAAA